MPNKSTDLLQHSYAIMVNDDAEYQPLTITEDTMLNDDYEPGNLFKILHLKITMVKRKEVKFLPFIIIFIFRCIEWSRR
jgi:hypothetical protein